MRKIIFTWSGVQHIGHIEEQVPSAIQGQRTVINVFDPISIVFVIHGKCEVGKCGPYTVQSITNPKSLKNETV